MLKNAIKIDDDTKDLLDQIQTKFSIKTYDTTVKTCVLFIIRNEINLKEDYIGDYRKGLIDLENRLSVTFKNHEDKIIKQNASLRSWFGAMESTYLKPLLSKLNSLDQINDYSIDKIKEEIITTPKTENPLNSHLKNDDTDTQNVQQLKNEFSQKEIKFKETYTKYETQKQALFKIFNNSKIETGGMLSKERIFVNLSIEEWDELKKLV